MYPIIQVARSRDVLVRRTSRGARSNLAAYTTLLRNARRPDSVRSLGAALNPHRKNEPCRPMATAVGVLWLMPPEMDSASGESVNPSPDDTTPGSTPSLSWKPLF